MKFALRIALAILLCSLPIWADQVAIGTFNATFSAVPDLSGGAELSASGFVTNTTGASGSPVATHLDFLNNLLSLSWATIQLPSGTTASHSLSGSLADLASGNTFTSNFNNYCFNFLEGPPGPPNGTLCSFNLLQYSGHLSSTTFALADGGTFTASTDLISASFSNTGEITLFANGTETLPTPEPSAILLFGSGCAGMFNIVRRRYFGRNRVVSL